MGALALVVLVVLIESIGMPPRLLASYIDRRTSGHNSAIVLVGDWLGKLLLALDRGKRPDVGETPPALLSTTADRALPVKDGIGAKIIVAAVERAQDAFERAQAGDIITFLPGTYRFSLPIDLARPGTAEAPIVVRAERPDTVVLEFDLSEGFHVKAPHWTFENLNIHGVCRDHSACEHAFHVVGNALHFVARNNKLTDFNAHFKVNGQAGRFPDHGLIEGNVISNTSIRQTGSPVTPIDLVGVSHWVVRRNSISDFAKAGSDQTSYGAFAKGGGSRNRFENNIVLCENRLRGGGGRRVGLSLGGGGSSDDACRGGRCVVEQEGSVIDSNLVAYCSDEGIYLNRAASSRIVHNTVLDTAGVVVRYEESSAEVQGNLVDGAIRSRDGGLVHAADNLSTRMTQLYLGWHPARKLFLDAANLRLQWRGDPPRLLAVSRLSDDVCGAPRPPEPAYGAFEDFSRCRGPGD